MIRESKMINAPMDQINKRIKENETFGWEILAVGTGIDNDYNNIALVAMTRDTNNTTYDTLVNYEKQYEELILKLNALSKPPVYVKMNLIYCALLFVALILPLAVYILVKAQERKRFLVDIKIYQDKTKELHHEIEELTEESKRVFYASKK